MKLGTSLRAAHPNPPPYLPLLRSPAREMQDRGRTFVLGGKCFSCGEDFPPAHFMPRLSLPASSASYSRLGSVAAVVLP